jgi:acylpyruvate hydrolase
MKIVMYQYAERDYRLGAMTGGERIVDLNYAYENLLAGRGEPRFAALAAAIVPDDSVAFLAGGGRSWQGAAEALDNAKASGCADIGACGKRFVFERSEVKLGAPVRNPLRIICLSHNYHDFRNRVPLRRRRGSSRNTITPAADDPIIYRGCRRARL